MNLENMKTSKIARTFLFSLATVLPLAGMADIAPAPFPLSCPRFSALKYCPVTELYGLGIALVVLSVFYFKCRESPWRKHITIFDLWWQLLVAVASIACLTDMALIAFSLLVFSLGYEMLSLLCSTAVWMWHKFDKKDGMLVLRRLIIAVQLLLSVFVMPFSASKLIGWEHSHCLRCGGDLSYNCGYYCPKCCPRRWRSTVESAGHTVNRDKPKTYGNDVDQEQN